MRIRLSVEERDLILEHAQPSSELARKLRLGLLDGRILTFELSLSEVEDLLRCTDRQLQRSNSRKLKRRFQRAYKRVVTAAEKQSTEGLSGGFDEPERAASDPIKAAEELLSSREFTSLDKANSALAKLSSSHNAKPCDEFQGLSPDQVDVLIYSDWTSPEAGMYCRDDLPFAEVDKAEILHNARVFLAALQDEQGAKATAKGNLNRKFVASMVDSMRWPNGYVEDLWRYNKVLDEQDVSRLHVLKIVLEIAGFIRTFKGRFVISGKGEASLQEGKAASLFALLFRTYLEDFNLGYTDGYEANPSVQNTVAYSLYVLGLNARRWCSMKDLAEVVFLPSVSATFQPLSYTLVEEALLHVRLVRPLIRFGLIEAKTEREPETGYPSLARIRTTPLYAKFLHFALSQ